MKKLLFLLPAIFFFSCVKRINPPPEEVVYNPPAEIKIDTSKYDSKIFKELEKTTKLIRQTEIEKETRENSEALRKLLKSLY